MNTDEQRLKNRERQRRYRIRHKERLAAERRKKYPVIKEAETERHREWAKKNAAHLREYNRKRYAADPSKKIARAKAYRESHPGYCAGYSKKWVRDNPERARLLDNAQKAKRRAAGKYTPDDVIALRKEQSGKCAYCKVKLTRQIEHVDHIIPIALGGSNSRQNIQLLCASCNKRKGAKHPIAYAQSIGRLI